MIIELRFREGFDPLLLSWLGPDEPAAEECSICDAPFGPDDVPLIASQGNGWTIRLCEKCVAVWVIASSAP